MALNFWMIVSNPDNYRITRDQGFTVQGLKAQHKRKIQRIGAGDRVLLYVSVDRYFAATATATSSYFEDSSSLWEKEGRAEWPYRIQIKPEIVLEDSQFIDANLLAPRLDYIKRWPPENWHWAFQGNLHLLPKNDFLLIEEEMKKLKFGANYRRDDNVPRPPVSRNNRRRRSGRAGPSRPNAENQR